MSQEIYRAPRELQQLDRWIKDAPAGHRTLTSPDKQYYVCLNEQSKIILVKSRGLGIPPALQTCENVVVMDTYVQAQKLAPLTQWRRNV